VRRPATVVTEERPPDAGQPGGDAWGGEP
jgi:hypothetical protein